MDFMWIYMSTVADHGEGKELVANHEVERVISAIRTGLRCLLSSQ